MFNQEVLTEMFKGKTFGYGQYHLYFYSEGFDLEEEECDVEILDGIVKITTWDTNTDLDNHERTEISGYDYIPFEKIKQISFGKDF